MGGAEWSTETQCYKQARDPPTKRGAIVRQSYKFCCSSTVTLLVASYAATKAEVKPYSCNTPQSHE